MHNLISLCGWKQCGKSHAARVLSEQLGYAVHKMAAPLKQIVSDAFGVDNIEAAKTQPVDWFEGSEKIAYRTVIGVLQQLGMPEGNAIDRATRKELRMSPLPQLGGITPAQMVSDVKELYDTFLSQNEDNGVSTTYRQILQGLGTDVMRNKWDKDIHVTMLDEWLAKNKDRKIVFDDVRFPNEIALMKKYGGVTIWLHRPALTMTDFHESETSIGESDCDELLISAEGGKLDRDIINAVKHNFTIVQQQIWDEEE